MSNIDDDRKKHVLCTSHYGINMMVPRRQVQGATCSCVEPHGRGKPDTNRVTGSALSSASSSQCTHGSVLEAAKWSQAAVSGVISMPHIYLALSSTQRSALSSIWTACFSTYYPKSITALDATSALTWLGTDSHGCLNRSNLEVAHQATFDGYS